MNGLVPQWGAREKHPILIQMFIDELSKHGEVVVKSAKLLSNGNLYIHVSTTTHYCLNDSTFVCIVH